MFHGASPLFRHGYGITAKLGVFSGLRFRSMQDFHTCVLCHLISLWTKKKKARPVRGSYMYNVCDTYISPLLPPCSSSFELVIVSWCVQNIDKYSPNHFTRFIRDALIAYTLSFLFYFLFYFFYLGRKAFRHLLFHCPYPTPCAGRHRCYML